MHMTLNWCFTRVLINAIGFNRCFIISSFNLATLQQFFEKRQNSWYYHFKKISPISCHAYRIYVHPTVQLTASSLQYWSRTNSSLVKLPFHNLVFTWRPMFSLRGGNHKIVKLCWKYLKTLPGVSDVAHGPLVEYCELDSDITHVKKALIYHVGK